jgi:hypothetical protein
MTSVRDPYRHVFTLVLSCGVCGHPIYLSETPNRKRVAFDVTADNEPTRNEHPCPSITKLKRDRAVS